MRQPYPSAREARMCGQREVQPKRQSSSQEQHTDFVGKKQNGNALAANVLVLQQ